MERADMQSSKRSEQGFWRADRKRYEARAWLTQPSYWAVMVYRFGRWTKTAHHPFRFPAHAAYYLAYSVVRLATGIDIPRGVTCGPGLLIHHFGGIIVNPSSTIGSNLTLRQGVTIGTKQDHGPVPVIGDDVIVGAYAQILGAVRVGDGSVIGAMSVVLTDVAAGSVVAGIPARLLRKKGGNPE